MKHDWLLPGDVSGAGPFCLFVCFTDPMGIRSLKGDNREMFVLSVVRVGGRAGVSAQCYKKACRVLAAWGWRPTAAVV